MRGWRVLGVKHLMPALRPWMPPTQRPPHLLASVSMDQFLGAAAVVVRLHAVVLHLEVVFVVASGLVRGSGVGGVGVRGLGRPGLTSSSAQEEEGKGGEESDERDGTEGYAGFGTGGKTEFAGRFLGGQVAGGCAGGVAVAAVASSC